MHFNAASQATIVNNSRSGDQGISTNVALPKGGLLRYNEALSSGEPKPIISNVARGPKARRQQFSMSSLSPVLRYVVTALFRSNSPLRARQH